MNLIDRLAYYPDPSDKVLLRKFSSQEALPTQPCYESAAIAKIQNRFASQTFEDNGPKLTPNDRMRQITDTYRGPELPASAPETSRTNIGKVRQLFEERRKQIRRPIPTALTSRATAVGRDKSYPLQPIRRRKVAEDSNGDENNIFEPEPADLTRPIIYDCSIFGKLPNLGGRLLSEKKLGTESEIRNYFSRDDEMSAGSHRTVNSSVTKITEGISRLATKQVNGVQKKPQNRSIPLPQQRNVPLIKKPTRTSNTTNNDANMNDQKKLAVRSSPTNGPNNLITDQKKPPTIRSSPTKTVAIKKPIANGTTRPQIQKTRPAPVKTTPPPGMASCKVCGRHFASDRVELHQEICEKASKKKRKAYDPVKHRLKGTDAEGMISQIKTKTKAPPQPPKKGNWRKQHEEFLNNIRAARMVKQHLAGGGKLSDLPPPPPMDTSDYVQCPHCNRKFNEAAAERHIPKCVNIKHNKPKNNIPAARTGPSKLPSNNKVNMTRKR